MINTLQNSPERVPSKGGNKFKKAVALAIALTLSGEPAEAKTYEKQEFPTEMLASIPGEYTPMTENVEQATVPNYINQAQNGVKKYYPEFKGYFEEILTKIKGYEPIIQKIINDKIHWNFETFSDEINSEEDKLTILLIVFEQINGTTRFIKSNKIIDDDIKKGIAEEIYGDINNQIKKNINKTQREINNKQRERQELSEKNEKLRAILNSIENNESSTSIILKIEDYFKLVNIGEIKNDKGLLKIIEIYIKLNKQINRTPSEKGKTIIEEYKKNKP